MDPSLPGLCLLTFITDTVAATGYRCLAVQHLAPGLARKAGQGIVMLCASTPQTIKHI
jgi:hypothetical protein